MLGLPEVTMNLDFIPICTRSYEVRAKKLIKLTVAGKVERVDENDDGITEDVFGPDSDAHISGVPVHCVREDPELGLPFW